MTTLKPCPFCGHPPHTEETGYITPTLTIECHHLGCGVYPYISDYDHDRAIKRWNTRAVTEDRKFLIELSDSDLYDEYLACSKIRNYLKKNP
jgi:hypothetical protein